MTLSRSVPTLNKLIQAVSTQNPKEELMIIKEIVQIFRSQNLAAQQQLLEQCPPFPAKSQLLALLDLNNRAAHVNTLSIVAIAYSSIPPLELGVIFGKAGFFLANDYRKNPESALTQEILFTALSQSVRGCSTALYTLGRYEELLAFSKPALKVLKQGNSLLENSNNESSKAIVRNNLNFLRLSAIDASIKCQRYDRAQALVDIQQKYIDLLTPSDRYKFEILQVLLKILTVSPDVFSLVPVSFNEDELLVLNQLDLLVKMMSDYGQKNPNDRDKMASSISKISEIKISIETQSINQIEAAKKLMESFGSPSDIERVRLNIDTANSIFFDPKKEPDLVSIEQSIATLQAALQWTRANHFSEEECEALRGLAICYKRQEKIQPDPNLQKELAAKSVEMLLALRKNIELIRSGIVDPFQRVYWMNWYVYLFPMLCEQLYKLDRSLELLNAIEGSKGRVLADVLTQKDERPIADFDFSASVKQLPALMKQVGAHYLTYLVDDEETFAVLVAKDGSLHTHSVAIGKTQLNQWLSDDSEGKNLLDPTNWGKRITAKIRLPNLSELLAPFVSWLEPYAKAGLIQPNDHFCYSPDASLHLIPLHYLPFLGNPLVCYVSVSRIHGAAALVELMKQPPEKPFRLTAVYVPAKSDSQNGNGELAAQQKLEDIRWIADWLKETKKMDGTITSNTAADLSTVTQLHFSQRLVHFSTHGTFPSRNEQDRSDAVSPYRTSGLVLAKDGELPEDSDGQGSTLLTPEEIIKGKLNFSGSHVTMQACVSGKAKEGIGGDAIGLDWALMLAKASSVLSTHWYVDAGGARLFSQTFYQYWLFENDYSRAQAWRKTILDLMEDRETASPSDWAAFSLSGDWR
jgi:tetratricopeptide (TPR) repeat protein